MSDAPPAAPAASAPALPAALEALVQKHVAVVFTKAKCTYCVKARALLEQHLGPDAFKDVLWLDVEASADHEDWFLAAGDVHKRRLVPMVFLRQTYVGGFADLDKLLTPPPPPPPSAQDEACARLNAAVQRLAQATVSAESRVMMSRAMAEWYDRTPRDCRPAFAFAEVRTDVPGEPWRTLRALVDEVEAAQRDVADVDAQPETKRARSEEEHPAPAPAAAAEIQDATTPE